MGGGVSVQQLKDLNPVKNLPLDFDLPHVEPPDEATVTADNLTVNSGETLGQSYPVKPRVVS